MSIKGLGIMALSSLLEYFPINDPLYLDPAMAAAAKNLTFGITLVQRMTFLIVLHEISQLWIISLKVALLGISLHRIWTAQQETMDYPPRSNMMRDVESQMRYVFLRHSLTIFGQFRDCSVSGDLRVRRILTSKLPAVQ